MKSPHPIWSILGILIQGVGLFLLPFIVGLAASLFLEVSQVADTGHVLAIGFAIFIVPPLLAQFLGVIIRIARERRMLIEAGRLSVRHLLATIHRHMRIVTPQGWAALLTGLWFVLLSLAFKWASLGLLAVMSLLMFYLVLGASSFISTFLVKSFASGIGRGVSGIVREMSPAVIDAGDSAEERFHLTRIPVPAGYNLLIEDDNPPVLQTESRYAIGPGARRRKVTVSGRMRVTPRGLHTLGPARIYYGDLLGFTRVSVASLATATLKVLPRFRPLVIIEPPRSRLQAPDVLTRPHRFATEDMFRFKEYASGDDTRRIHWRLSIRTGRLQVRRPESREISTRQVLLVLDNYLTPGPMLKDAVGIAKVLDHLVETWISVARELVDRGDQVTLVAVVDDGEGNLRIEQQLCNKGTRRRWQDLGARACWQGVYDLPQILERVGESLHAVAVSSRFFAPPPNPNPGQDFTWVYLPPLEALGQREPAFWEQWVGPGPGAILRLFARIFQLPAAAGSNQNTLVRQVKDFVWLHKRYAARRRLRWVAWREGQRTLSALMGRNETVYKLEPGAGAHRLVGLVAGGGRAEAAK